MYPSPAREQKLPWMKGAHKDPHNGLLEQRITRHRRSGESPARYDRAGEVTALRQADPAEPGREDDPRAHLDARSLQPTLRRVDRAFQHFFRTCRNPEFGGHPGFPRFEPFGRYSGWTCNHQSGRRIAPKGEDRPVGDDRAGAERRFLAVQHGRRFEALPRVQSGGSRYAGPRGRGDRLKGRGGRASETVPETPGAASGRSCGYRRRPARLAEGHHRPFGRPRHRLTGGVADGPPARIPCTVLTLTNETHRPGIRLRSLVPMRPTRPNRRTSLLRAALPILLVPALSGCTLWGASQAAVSLWPVITGDDAGSAGEDERNDPYSHLVSDQGSAWSREVLLPGGVPFDATRYRSGDPVLTRWTIPVDVGRGVEAVVALSRRTCRDGQAVPARWTLRRADGSAAGEAWRTARARGADLSTAPGSYEIGVVRSEALGSHLQTPVQQRVTWLLVVPSPGRYHLTILWRGTDPAAVVDAQPCIEQWTKVPLAAAMQATDQPGAAPVAGAGRQYGQSPRTWTRTSRTRVGVRSSADSGQEAATGPGPNTTDEGISLSPTPASPDPARAALSPTGSRPATADRTSYETRQVAGRLGLLGRPGYDLMRLHQEALIYEVSRRRARDFPEARIRALRTLRQQRLSTLAQADPSSPAGRALCQLSWKPGLTGRPLALWQETSTVPSQLARRCRSGD